MSVSLRTQTLLPPANEVCEGYVFARVCQSFCSGGGEGGVPACSAGGIPAYLAGLGGVVSQHALQVSRPSPRREVEGSGWGGSPGPHPRGKLRGLAWGGLQAHTQGDLQAHTLGGLQAHTQGGVPACTEADTPPPSRRLLPQVLRILLECILVTQSYYSSPQCRVNFNRYTIQFPDFSNTSYYNLEHRLTIMSNNFIPLSNRTHV